MNSCFTQPEDFQEAGTILRSKENIQADATNAVQINERIGERLSSWLTPVRFRRWGTYMFLSTFFAHTSAKNVDSRDNDRLEIKCKNFCE